MFTPYSFIFFSLYNVFILTLFTVRNFYYYWMLIEIVMLLFIGLSYTLFVSSYSHLMSYFIIQALSSFIILLAYIYDSSVIMTISIFLKLSIFPFFFWYINVMYRFPNFILWLGSTIHKLPVIVLLMNFNIQLELSLLWSSILMTTLIRGLMMITLVDLRMLVVLSSVGNNSWILLGYLSSLFTFILFFIIYSLSLFIIFTCFKGMSKVPLHSSFQPTSYKLSLYVLFVSGMPPFPLFYAKMLLIYSLLSVYGLNYLFAMFLLFRSLILMGYIQSLIKYFIYVYSSVSHYLLKY